MNSIERMLVLSTGNITRETCDALCSANSPVASWAKGNYGCFAYVPPCNDGLSSDLAAAFDSARRAGCEWVMFDCDAPLDPSLPNFDW